ncbi:MAG: hypothetical protein KIS94_09020 [Chitinophagales bacterium]|nr:hypothetical protein [Chitinophagales bacterium]
MKKILFALLALTLVFAACNKKAFLKKLVGTWKIDRYLFDGLERTLYFDTTFRDYTLLLNEDQIYAINYNTYSFAPDSIILVDTLGYDSVNMVYVINSDTLRFMDTTITPYMETGKWDLINSDEDLQLRNDANNNVSIYRILELTRKDLKLKKGNEEFYFGK